MKHPAPAVYVSGERLDDSAEDDAPVLGGLSMTFGVESYLDYQEPETATFTVRVAHGQVPLIVQGAEVAIYQDSVDVAQGITWFAGRIASLRSTLEPEHGRYLIHVSAVSTLSETKNRQIVPVMPREAGSAREARLLGMIGWPYRVLPAHYAYPDSCQRAAKQPSNLLTVLDLNLRASRRIRRDVSYFTPETGVIQPMMEVLDDVIRLVGADHLVTLASGTWDVTYADPSPWGGKNLVLSGGEFRADEVEFVQDSDDLVTRLNVDMSDTTVEETKTVEVTKYAADYAANIAAYGNRLLSISTDLPADTGTNFLTALAGHYIQPSSDWRIERLKVADTERLTLSQIADLIAPAGRFGTYVIITNPLTARPASRFSTIRGAVIGGQATWTGKDWDIEINLGRSSDIPNNSGWWTLGRVADSTNPFISGATFNSVGTKLTLGDFRRIGP